MATGNVETFWGSAYDMRKHLLELYSFCKDREKKRSNVLNPVWSPLRSWPNSPQDSQKFMHSIVPL